MLLWQKFVVGSIFGWRRVDNGKRRFESATVFIPKKNGKSPLAAGIGLACMVLDGEQGAEIYCGATKKDQAKIVWSCAKAYIEKSKALSKKLEVKETTNRIIDRRNYSFFTVLGKDSKTQDGFKPYVGLIDEYHQHKDADIFDIVNQGFVNRSQPLMFVISTSGYNENCPCREEWDHVLNILNKIYTNEQYFGYVATLDTVEDEKENESLWKQEEEWYKCNPSLTAGVKKIDKLRNLFRDAEQKPDEQNKFKVKQLNTWVSGAVQWIDLEQWDKCPSSVDLEKLKGEKCYIGLDLASNDDFCAKVLVFPPGPYKEWVILPTFYIPKKCIKQPRKTKKRRKDVIYGIEKWVAAGWVKATPGNITDYDAIENDIIKDTELYDVAEVPFDPHQANQIATHLMEREVDVVKFTQTYTNYHEPVERFDGFITGGKIRTDGNPAMRWMVGNTVLVESVDGYKKPDRKNSSEKIDGVCGALMGVARALLEFEEEDIEPEIYSL